MHELRDFLSSGWQLWYSTRSRRELFAIVALSIGIVFAQPIYAEEQASSWITDEKLATLKTIGTDPINDLEVKGNYHWRYRAKNWGWRHDTSCRFDFPCSCHSRSRVR